MKDKGDVITIRMPQSFDEQDLIQDVGIKNPRYIDLYSNWDHELDLNSEKKLKENGQIRGFHAAENFHGQVWFDAEKNIWFNEIWRFNVKVETIDGDSVQEVSDAANEEYGDS